MTNKQKVYMQIETQKMFSQVFKLKYHILFRKIQIVFISNFY